MNLLRCTVALLCVILLPDFVEAQTSVDPPPEMIELSHLGGTPFVISGTNLPTDTTQYSVDIQVPGFGFFAVTVVAATPTELSLLAPPLFSGGGGGVFGSPANLQISIAGFGFPLSGAVTYIGPFAIESVDPVVVSEAGGDTVTVTGVAFTPDTQVRVAGILVPTTYVDVRTLTVSTPPLAPGSHDVEVLNSGGGGGGGGGFGVLPGALIVPAALDLETFEPTTASELGGTPFVLSGSGFTPNTVVEIAGSEVAVSLDADSNLTGIIPPRGSTPLGFPVTVSADDPQTGSGEILGAFTYVGVELIAVTPSVVVLGTTSQLTLDGTGFTPETTVQIGDGAFVESVEFVDSTQLLVNLLDPIPGYYDVGIQVVEAGSSTVLAESVLPNSLTVIDPENPPVIDFVFPAVVCDDEPTFVTVYGENFLAETQVHVNDVPITERQVSADGTRITGRTPSGLVVGAAELVVSDFRGNFEANDFDIVDQCATLISLQQMESSVAYGQAAFEWHNPEAYTSIEVYDDAGLLVDVLPGNATTYAAGAPSGELALSFVGVANDECSAPVFELAAVYQCDYPPPLSGAVQAGSLALSIRGGHAPADVDRCSDGDGPQGPFETIRFTQPIGSIGVMQPQWTLGLLGAIEPPPTTLRTGFTLDQPADRLDISGYYRKIATDFGLELRGRLVHVFPDDGFTDEFTFPDPFVGGDLAKHTVTYYRAQGDVADGAEPCPDGSGGFKQIPAGDYLLEIYAVGGTPAVPYYIFADDPRDSEILIEGTPCPPYPLVQVRDVSGLRTLPNISDVKIDSVSENADGTVRVEMSARGTWIDENGTPWSVDPYCDFSIGYVGSDGIFHGVCQDVPQHPNAPFQYCWALHVTHPPTCTFQGPTWDGNLADYGCYKIELTVRDRACAISRTTFHEVAIVPNGDVCTLPDYSFLYPTPDPSDYHGIVGLSNPAPGNGQFNGKRLFETRVLVIPECDCAGVSPCSTPQVEPQGAPGSSGPEDDVQFKLAIRRNAPPPPPGQFGPQYEYFDLPAAVMVEDLCPDVEGGAKYLRVFVEDLGEIACHPELHDHEFRTVVLRARTNCVRVLQPGGQTVCGPPTSNAWHTVGEPMMLVNHPVALNDSFWTGHYEEGDATYRFAVRSTDDPEEPFLLEDTEEQSFGIVDAGVPAYEGNQVSTGFTSRIACQRGVWLGEDGAGSASGSMLENQLDTVPQEIGASEISSSGFLGGSGLPAYEYCQHTDIFDHEMSQDLFRSIIYAGFIGPVPVNIWASVGFGLNIAIDSYLEFRVSPFDALPTGNYVEMQYTLDTNVDIWIPCQISADVLGGIASIAMRLRPIVMFDFQPYIIAGLRGTPNITLDYFMQATFELWMDVEACIQTIIFGEQCLPTIEIPLVEDVDLFPPHGVSQVPEECNGGEISSFADSTTSAAALGTLTISSYELANQPISIVSPDGTVVVDAWASEESAAKVLKVCVTENGEEPIVFSTGLPGTGWYFLDPQAVFIDNETVVFSGTAPPFGFTAEMPPSDLADPDYLSIRNANVAYTEIKLGLLKKNGTIWELELNQTEIISDPVGTPTTDRRADGRAALSTDFSNGTILASWVRYSGDYLIQDGFVDRYLPEPGCAEALCLVTAVPNVRPQMETSNIVVRRVDENGIIPGEDFLVISDPGINVQPSISVSPSGDAAYCVWVHDPTHTDLLESNRGRHLMYSVYEKATDSWSPPLAVLVDPDQFPGLLEPSVVLKSDDDGLVVFTALPPDAPEDDSGFGGGSRYLFGCRLIDGVFQEPTVIRGRCDARTYGWGSSVSWDLGVFGNPADNVYHELPEWVMTYQDFGTMGLAPGSGNVMVTMFDEATNEWTPPIALMEPGSIMTNVSATVANGCVHSIHFDAGPATATGVAGYLAGGGSPGYKIHDTVMHPDAAIVRCELSDPMSGPGSMVDGHLVVENQGLASTAYDLTGESLIGVELVFITDTASGPSETVMQTFPLPVLRVGESYAIDFAIEMPRVPVRFVARINPNVNDRNTSNDSSECYLGAPAPEYLACTVTPRILGDESTGYGVILEWDNPVIYDLVLIYRDGTMIHAVPGGCERFTDFGVTEGETYDYQVRGVVGVSKSAKTLAVCSVTAPTPSLEFLRGNANGDGSVNIADAVFLLAYLFQAGAEPPCMASGDANGDGAVNIADAVHILSYLFQAGAEPMAPFPECGESSFDHDLNLGCEASGC